VRLEKGERGLKTYRVRSCIASPCPKSGDYGSTRESEEAQALDYGLGGIDNALPGASRLMTALGTLLLCGRAGGR
jgi:hypothetical protein